MTDKHVLVLTGSGRCRSFRKRNSFCILCSLFRRSLFPGDIRLLKRTSAHRDLPFEDIGRIRLHLLRL